MAHPDLDHGRGDPAVVGCVLEVAVVEVAEARHLAVLATGDRLADDEGRAGSAMVGALAGVLLHAAAEFAEGHEHDVLAAAEPRDIFNECSDMVGGIGPEAGVDVALVY